MLADLYKKKEKLLAEISKLNYQIEEYNYNKSRFIDCPLYQAYLESYNTVLKLAQEFKPIHLDVPVEIKAINYKGTIRLDVSIQNANIAILFRHGLFSRLSTEYEQLNELLIAYRKYDSAHQDFYEKYNFDPKEIKETT